MRPNPTGLASCPRCQAANDPGSSLSRSGARKLLPPQAARHGSLKSKRSRACSSSTPGLFVATTPRFCRLHVNVVVGRRDVRGDAQFRARHGEVRVHLFCEQQTGLPLSFTRAASRAEAFRRCQYSRRMRVQDLSASSKQLWVGTLSVWPAPSYDFGSSYTRQTVPESGIAPPRAYVSSFAMSEMETDLVQLS